MMRLGLFGGTFNPPHLAHKRLAFCAAEAAQLDKVLIIPDAEPPHQAADALVSGEDRLELCRRTFFEPLFEVSDLELRRAGKSYTIDTVRALHETMQPDELFLIIGSDMLLTFHQWREYEAILSLCKLVILSRETEITADDLTRYAEETLGLSAENGDFLVLTDLPQVLSSTGIRQKIAAGEPVDDLLTPQALAYIEAKGLYQ